MSKSEVYTLRPSILVILKTKIVGGRRYVHETIEGLHRDRKTGAQIRKWTTTSIVDDPEEQEQARATVSAVWSTISPLCRSTGFGLMAPEDKLTELEAAVPQAYAVADAFNKTAKQSRVSVSIMLGRVAADDVLATEAMRREVDKLIQRAQEGIASLNPKAVRDAMNSLCTQADMLSDQMKAKADEVIGTARASANETAKVIRALEKAGEEVAMEVDQAALEQLEAARIAFLDLTDPGDSVASIVVSDDRVMSLD